MVWSFKNKGYLNLVISTGDLLVFSTWDRDNKLELFFKINTNMK